MSPPEAVKREEEADGVYELSSSNTNSDDPREAEEVDKRASPSGFAHEGLSNKKQKLEPADDLRLSVWRCEDSKNQAQGDSDTGHEVKVASPVALPFFPQPSPEESAPTRTLCRQFWKAGDYDGQLAVQQPGAMQQEGEYSITFNLMH